MQVGIASQLPHGVEVTAKVRGMLEAAREGGFPVFFSRRVSLPEELMGVFQLRQAMARQRVERAVDDKSDLSFASFVRALSFHGAPPSLCFGSRLVAGSTVPLLS